MQFDMGDRVSLVEELVERHKSKAKELLVDYCQREDVRLDVVLYLARFYRSGPSTSAHSHPSRLDTASESQHKSTSFDARTIDLPDTHRARPHQVFSNVAPGLPLSPARTASVTSHSTLPDPSGRETVLLLSGDRPEQPACCRSASIEHSLITDSVANSRAQDTLEALPEDVDIRVPTASGSILVKSRSRASITWRRRKEFNSNCTVCFVVPAKWLDTDIIFTPEEAAGLQSSPGYNNTFKSHVQLDHGFVVEELDNKGLAPRSVTSPHTPSDLLGCLPHDARPLFEHVENLAARQRMHILAERDIPPHHDSSIHTVPVPKLASVDIDSGQRQHMTTSPTVTASGKERDSSLDQIRLTGRWGRIPINLKMDLNAPGEVFYQTFCRWAEERNRKIERERTVLWLKRDKSMGDDFRFDFSLSEEELEEIWEAVVEWVQENKREKGPHIYVEVKTGTE